MKTNTLHWKKVEKTQVYSSSRQANVNKQLKFR